MAVCRWCEREMTAAASCTIETMHVDGVAVAMIPWRRRSTSQRCGDCGVRPGGFHHLGCDMQRCPVCRGQMMSCDCRFDEDGLDDDENDDWLDRQVVDVFLDANGVPCERVRVGDQDVTVHYEDLPPGDVTTVEGIRCTTALRTVIDIAPDVDLEHLRAIVRDALDRNLFTVEEARARLAEADMKTRPGAMLLRELLSDGAYYAT